MKLGDRQSLQSRGSTAETAFSSRQTALGGRYWCDREDSHGGRSPLRTTRPLMGFEEGVVAVFSPSGRQVGGRKVHGRANEAGHV